MQDNRIANAAITQRSIRDEDCCKRIQEDLDKLQK